MQHVGIRRETSNGEVLAQFDSEGLDLRLLKRAPPLGTCLRFVDPYGDTVFNQLQLAALASELSELRTSAPEVDLRSHIDRLLVFLAGSEDVHVYVRFIGD